MYVTRLRLGSSQGLNLKKLIRRSYVDVSAPGIAYQLAHGRGVGFPITFESVNAPLPSASTIKTKAAAYDWALLEK